MKESANKLYGNSSTQVILDFHIRAEKVYKKFIAYVKKNEKQLLENGWDIGRKKLSYIKKDLHMYIEADEEISAIKFKYVFSSDIDIIKDINNKYKHISKILEIFSKELPNMKVSLDIEFSNNLYLEAYQEELVKLSLYNGFIQIKNTDKYFRRFQIRDRYNIIDKIKFYQCKSEFLNTNISINIDNIVVNIEKLNKQLITSAYFYMVNYCKLHYEYMKNCNKEYVDKNLKFYKKLETFN